jgi:AhpD family alkylhydroperoxidase
MITPGDRADLGRINWAIAVVAGRASGTGPLNLFRVLGRHRRLFRGWLRFAGRLMPGGKLPRRDSELVILRVATLRGCTYELEHHRRLAARAGLTPADVERVADGPDATGWRDRDRVLLAAVDELHRDGTLGDATWEVLRRHVDERQAIELVLLAGHYEMLATAVAALRIPLDRPRRG